MDAWGNLGTSSTQLAVECDVYAHSRCSILGRECMHEVCQKGFEVLGDQDRLTGVRIMIA